MTKLYIWQHTSRSESLRIADITRRCTLTNEVKTRCYNGISTASINRLRRASLSMQDAAFNRES